MAGLTPGESAPLCAQVAPECCCVESVSADNKLELQREFTHELQSSELADQNSKTGVNSDHHFDLTDLSGDDVANSQATTSIDSNTLLQELTELKAPVTQQNSASNMGGHDDCCCAPASDPVSSDCTATPPNLNVDIAEVDVRAVRKLDFPFNQNFLASSSSNSTRPLHLATNKVYLLKRCLLI